MSKTSLVRLIIPGILIFLGGLYLCTFVVDQTQWAIKIRLGKPVAIYNKPGLKFKIPFITNVFFVENRLLVYSADPGSIITKDKKEMIVDNYSKWRVIDPLKFYETVRSVEGAQSRLDDVVYSQMREVLGKYTLSQIISGDRVQIMEQVTKNAREAAKVFGIDIVDVRIKRADLPESNSLAVYGRMEEERRREARRYRSEGSEEALRIRSEADRQKVELTASAQKQAEELRGDAEALAISIYAKAYQKDPEFFKFQRSHDAYRMVLDSKTTFLISSDRDFFKFLK